jgi:hypothetical protein
VMKDPPATLESTWWMFDTEDGMDDLMTQAGDSLKPMFDRLSVSPFQDTQGDDRLFLARFEIPKHGEDFQMADGVIEGQDPVAFIDFLGGFPLDCCEMVMVIGERSSLPDKTAVLAGEGAVAPVPKVFFDGYDLDKILMNYTALVPENVQWMAKNLDGQPAPTNLHWWLRVNLLDSETNPAKFPVPGEFLALGVRMMPDVPWGAQKTSPFLFSGQWFDTVFYSGATIKSIQAPTEDVPYSTYTVTWRQQEISNVRSSDFAEYREGDQVCILKDIATTKKSQLWTDDDMKTWGNSGGWQIVPITFYGLDYA